MKTKQKDEEEELFVLKGILFIQSIILKVIVERLVINIRDVSSSNCKHLFFRTIKRRVKKLLVVIAITVN